tara:strand:+ start:195 stop:416 length:222 start_codon:yes stop_codon:yes gene_type:complete
MITKDQLAELETCINERDMWELVKSYNNVIRDIKRFRIANKHKGQTPESVLFEYLDFANTSMRDDYDQSRLGI